MLTIYKLTISVILLTSSFLTFAAEGKNHFPGVFVGATHAQDETNFTYGIEYEYKFTPKWGVGAVYEKTEKAHYSDGIDVKVAALYYHPYSYLRLGIGVGKEKIGGDHPHTEDLYRMSINYDYHFGDFNIEPTFAVDFIDGEKAFLVGVAFVRPF